MDEGGFGRRVHCTTRKYADSLHGRNQDDGPVAASHGGRKIAGQEYRTNEIHLHGVDKVGFRGGLDWSPGGLSSQGHEAVQGTCATCFIDQLPTYVRVQNVANDYGRPDTVLVREC